MLSKEFWMFIFKVFIGCTVALLLIETVKGFLPKKA